MKLVNSLDSKITNNTIATLGTFDGVHIGHQKILKKMIKLARKNNLESVVLTFFPHPRMVLHKDSKIKLLNTIEERIEILKKSGLDHIVLQEFTKEYSRMPAREFVRDILVNQLQVKTVIVGYDHHFGRNRSANIEDLREFGEHYDFNVIEIPAQEINEVSVSSTKIRLALKKGDIAKANKYLGYNFILSGTVVKGNSLGKTIDYPTANIDIAENYKLIPKKGVYIVKSRIEGNCVFGMMNIGKKPTVSGKIKTIEVHFFDFSQNLYGKKIQIEMLKRIRDEKKFDSIQDLKTQLEIDEKTAKEFIMTIQ